MLLIYDLNQNAFIQSAGIVSTLDSIAVKNATSQVWQIQFVRNGVAQALPVGTTLAFGAKPNHEYDADFVVYAGPEEFSGPDGSNLYSVAPNFNTEQLNAALQTDVVGGSSAIEPDSVTLMGELQFISSGNITASQTFSVIVANNVIKGDEGVPADATPGYYNTEQSDVRYAQRANNGSDFASVLAAFQNFFASVATAVGDLIYGGAGGTPTRLAGNSTATKKFLTQTGTGTASAAPGWNTIAATDLPVAVASGAGHAPGAVPDPGVTAGTTKFLCEDMTFKNVSLPYAAFVRKTANFTATPGGIYGIDTTAGSVTCTPFATPADGDWFRVFDIAKKWGTNQAVIGSAAQNYVDRANPSATAGPYDLSAVPYSGQGFLTFVWDSTLTAWSVN